MKHLVIRLESPGVFGSDPKPFERLKFQIPELNHLELDSLSFEMDIPHDLPNLDPMNLPSARVIDLGNAKLDGRWFDWLHSISELREFNFLDFEEIDNNKLDALKRKIQANSR